MLLFFIHSEGIPNVMNIVYPYFCTINSGCWLIASQIQRDRNTWDLAFIPVFLPDIPVRRRPRLVWDREWNATESPKLVHSSRPMTRPVGEHTDMSTYTKLVRMWSRYQVSGVWPHGVVTQVFTAPKIATIDANPGYPSIGSRTK